MLTFMKYCFFFHSLCKFSQVKVEFSFLFLITFFFQLVLVRKTQDKLHSMELKLHESESNQADRVDKSLLKNLLIGYIMAPNNDKQQILKLISSVLDFNQIESDKVGLNRTSNSWLNSILHGPSSPNANQTGK